MGNSNVCIANIGPGERRKRMWFGVALLGVGAAALIGLVVANAHRGWRIALLVPFWAGAVGLFQALEKT